MRSNGDLTVAPLQADQLYGLPLRYLLNATAEAVNALPAVSTYTHVVAAPTQSSWIHRLLTYDHSLTLGTELLTDRVLVVISHVEEWIFFK